MAERTRIRIWHPFPVDIVRPGTRKPERRLALAPIDVDVRTTSTEELTVASRFRPSSSYDTWKGELGGGPEVVLHGFDGSLWEPLPGPDGTSGATLEQWQASMTGGPLLPEPYELLDPILAAQYATPSGFVDGWDGAIRLGETAGRVIADSRQRGAERAIRGAESVLLVNGHVWRRAGPPFWSVEREGNLHKVYLCWNRTVKREWLWRDGVANLLGTFAADRPEEAVAYARECAASKGRKAEVRGPGGVCLAHDPRHASREDRLADGLHLGRPVMDRLDGLVKSLSTVGIEAYAEARILSCRLAEGDGDVGTVSALMAAFEAALADLERFDAPLASVSARDEMKRTLQVFASRMSRFAPAPEASGLPHPGL
ncbi:hypothetical protein BHAOGJBA_2974 [Methylobacterium hispanicum]|uniref:Uncharacterized protein n=1 Tax=Methylobacterium hispanicum TaxID=270350 RepID=A0AAV4ZMS6_9HYPH|nr:hypothetical protein [Methylobacterium hispanicum]GJD89447.1 hypothetical protein BHAOGJBA_2974 [Methylobacterium hispanicum]